ncbi:MAG: ribonuclease P protein component [Pirellulaceae bacterium]|nr:ribonuclease P protein component [Pirellulaceae bacterium]
MDANRSPSNRRFGKQDRVVKQFDFDRVHQGKWFAADRWLVVKGSANELEVARLGLSISKRVGNAVVRNRWKRTLREAFRNGREDIPVGWDFVVRPRKGARLNSFEVARSLTNLSQRLVSQCQRASARSGS